MLICVKISGVNCSELLCVDLGVISTFYSAEKARKVALFQGVNSEHSFGVEFYIRFLRALGKTKVEVRCQDRRV